MKKTIKDFYAWTQTPTGDTILGAVLYLAAFALLCSTPLWI